MYQINYSKIYGIFQRIKFGHVYNIHKPHSKVMISKYKLLLYIQNGVYTHWRSYIFCFKSVRIYINWHLAYWEIDKNGFHIYISISFHSPKLMCGKKNRTYMWNYCQVHHLSLYFINGNFNKCISDIPISSVTLPLGAFFFFFGRRGAND